MGAVCGEGAQMNIDGVIGALIITAVPWAWLWCMEYRDQMTYLSGHLAYINGKCREEKPQNDDYVSHRLWSVGDHGSIAPLGLVLVAL